MKISNNLLGTYINKMIRVDLSSKLIHLTRTVEDISASDHFRSILSECTLKGSSHDIRGGFKVVAFTEAPVSMLATVLATASTLNMRYAPLGIMVDKVWLYEQGGRPVIYQSEKEFELLPDSKKHLHVRYEPDRGIDYAWEREWRIKIDVLPLDPKITTVIVPTRSWEDHYYKMYRDRLKRGAIATQGLLPMPPPKWHFIVLEDLGIPFDNLESISFVNV